MHIVHSKHPEDYKLCTFKQVLIFIVAIFLFSDYHHGPRQKETFIYSFNHSINQDNENDNDNNYFYKLQ